MRKKLKKQLLISLCCFSLISLAVLLMPLAGERETLTQRGLNCAVGILFWIGLLSGILSCNRGKYIETVPSCGRLYFPVFICDCPVSPLFDQQQFISLYRAIDCKKNW